MTVMTVCNLQVMPPVGIEEVQETGVILRTSLFGWVVSGLGDTFFTVETRATPVIWGQQWYRRPQHGLTLSLWVLQHAAALNTQIKHKYLQVNSSDVMSFNDTHYINASSHNICTVTHVRTHSRSGTEEQNHRRRHVHKNTLINCGRRRRLAREAQNKYGWWLKSSVNTLHSNSRSSSFSSVSMFAGSAMGPSLARRASISRSVLSLSCFFFSWIFFSLEQDMNHK